MINQTQVFSRRRELSANSAFEFDLSFSYTPKRTKGNRRTRGLLLVKSISGPKGIRANRGTFFEIINKRSGTSIRYTRVVKLFRQ